LDDVPFGNADVGVTEESLGVEAGEKAEIVFVELEFACVMEWIPWMRTNPSFKAQWYSSIVGGPASAISAEHNPKQFFFTFF
jgi:hypothetical protein